MAMQALHHPPRIRPLTPTSDHDRDPAAQAVTVTGIGATHDLAPGTRLAQRFRIEGLIGVGGMGVVYLAHDCDLDIPVALKLLRPELARKPEALERFRRELLLARQVSSRHVVRIHDIGQHQGLTFITMDYVAGESLERLIERDGPMDPDRAAGIVRQVCEGLAAAHARQVVHRDLKPANILVNRDGEALITDFGVARSISASGMTQAGVIVGTPEYLSPEQARGEAVDGRSDLYAVGLILFEMLTGRLPFTGGTPAEALGQRLLRPPPSLSSLRPGLPAWLVQLCARLLRTQPSRRLPSAQSVIEAIDRRKVPREPLAWGRLGLAAAALVLLGLGVHWLMSLERMAPVPSAPEPRLLLLPLAGDAAIPLRLALEEHFGAWLRNDASLLLADPQRTRAALKQLGYGSEAALRNLDALRDASGGGRALAVTLTRQATGFQLRGELHATDATDLPPVEATGATALEAYLTAAPALFQLLEIAVPPMPTAEPDDDAVHRYGEALVSFRNGDPGGAIERLGQAATDIALTRLLRIEALADRGETLQARQLAVQWSASAAGDARLGGEIAIHAAWLGGDPDRALLLLQAQSDAYPEDLRYRLWLGEALGEAGERGAAEEILLAVVADDPQWGRAWFLLGKYAILRGDARRAVDEYLLRALLLYTRTGDLLGQAESTNALGAGYHRLGQMEEAKQHYARAAGLRERLGDRRGEAASLRNLALVQTVAGDFDGAESSLERARSILHAIDDRPGLASLYNNLGILSEERGNYPQALDAYRQGLALRQGLGDSRGVAESLNNVGFAYHQIGESDNALVYWRQASQAYADIEDAAGQARVQQSLALLEIARGEWASARSHLDASVLSAEDLSLPEEHAAGLILMAELARLQGYYAESLHAARRAADLFAQRGDERGRIEAALQLARTCLALAAKDCARESIDSVADNGRSSLEHRASRALLEARMGDGEEVASWLEQAAALAAEAGRAPLAGEIELERLWQRFASGDDLSTEVDALEAEVRGLGQATHQLRAAELALATDLRSGRRERGVSRYRDLAARIERIGAYQRSWQIHRLGARMLEGEAQANAIKHAAAARAALLEAAPETMRDALAQSLDQDPSYADIDP
jgi:eukaryotic-like serine/threonine-protein kinase